MTTNTQNPAPTAGRPAALLAAAGVLAAATLLAPSRASAAAAGATLTFKKNIPGTGDVKVLNYALALEDLEADLYAQALQRLTTGGTNALGTTIPGLNIDRAQPDVDYITQFGQVEVEHRDFLRSALGGSAIKPFKYDFAMESLTRQEVDTLILSAEQTGVGAYLGAIPYLATKTYLQIAGAIQGTEARHTAVITAVINQLFGKRYDVAPLAETNTGRDIPLAPDHVLARVSGFIVTS